MITYKHAIKNIKLANLYRSGPLSKYNNISKLGNAIHFLQIQN